MEISNNQIKSISLELKDVLTDFLDMLILDSVKNEEKIIREYRTKIIQLFTIKPTNHTTMGKLRGYIRNQTRIYNMAEFVYSSENVVDILRDVLGKSKHAMNGENILVDKICAFHDEEESFRCKEIIDYGYMYCKEHHETNKLKEKKIK